MSLVAYFLWHPDCFYYRAALTAALCYYQQGGF